MALNTQGILVDGNHVLVQVKILGRGAHLADIGTDHDGGRHDGPHGHLGFLFLVREPTVAHFEHVRVVPVARLCNLPILIVRIDNFVDAAVPRIRNPCGANVEGGTPQVGDLGHPLLVFPGANAEHDVASGITEGLGHAGVIFLLVGALGRVAVVVLPVVNAPCGKLLGVLFFFHVGAAFALPIAIVMVAGTLAAVTVKAKLEALRVHVIGQGLHAAGERGGVVLEVTFGIALGVHPVVVQVKVNVARIL